MKLKTHTKSILDKYNSGMKIKNIAADINCHVDSIRNFLKRNGIRTPNRSEGARKYHINENFFSKIDGPEKSYVLGLLYADGTVNEKSNSVTISLQERDKHILEKISNLIQPTKPLQFIPIKKYYPKENYQNQYRIVIQNKILCSNIITLKCLPNKTYTLNFPNNDIIPPNLFHHFIRGFFDGDGCISISYNKNKRPTATINFVSTKKFCSGLSKYLKTELNIRTKVRTARILCSDKIGVLAFGGTNQVLRFFDFLYNEDTISLNRKKERFIKFKANILKYLKNNKPTNVYRNTVGCINPYRVVKSLNYKTITIGTFSNLKEANSASVEWDKNHAGSSVRELNSSTSSCNLFTST